MRADALTQFHQRIRKASGEPHYRFLHFGPRCHIGWGYDHKPAGAPYLCRGEQGRGEVARVIFQYTLEGSGEYVEKNRSWAVEPGTGFITLHPSDYYYTKPREGHWAFFWLIVYHPFVVSRFEELRAREEPVQPFPPGDPALEAAAALFEQLCFGQLTKLWTFEERLFAWLWETERELDSRRYPGGELPSILDEVRRYVLQRLESPPSISELAGLHRMERTTFSRKFKELTGKTPAAFITEVRLDETLRQLRHGAKLKEIALATGFADENHFSKVFRQRFNLTPGAYRKLILRA